MTLQNTSRPPVKWRSYQIRPVAQSFYFAPSSQFGMIWNRPVGIQVQTPQGEEQFLPVYDLTRIIQVFIILGGLLLLFLLKLIYKRS